MQHVKYTPPSLYSDPMILEMTASEPLTLEEEYAMQRSWREDQDKCTFIVISRHPEHLPEVDRMAGDVNLYLHQWDESGHAEIEVMIAQEEFRRQGFAREAIMLMMQYGLEHLNIHRFYAKINQSNQPSLRLFSRLPPHFISSHTLIILSLYLALGMRR